MSAGGRVEGADEALKAFDEELKKIVGAAKTGMWDIALQVQGSAQRRLKASVVTGNLRASAYSRADAQVERLDASDMNPEANVSTPSDTHGTIWAEAGFTANYALYVHENMEGRSPKFLEEAVSQNETEIPKILQARIEAR